MLNNLGIKLVKYLLKKDLSIEERNKIVIHLMDIVQALPLNDIINVNSDGEILINGSSLDLDKARQLREHARVALDNKALRLIREQVSFQAIALGVHQVESERQMLFARAALWWGQTEDKLLKSLAQRTEEVEL